MKIWDFFFFLSDEDILGKDISLGIKIKIIRKFNSKDQSSTSHFWNIN